MHRHCIAWTSFHSSRETIDLLVVILADSPQPNALDELAVQHTACTGIDHFDNVAMNLEEDLAVLLVWGCYRK